MGDTPARSEARLSRRGRVPAVTGLPRFLVPGASKTRWAYIGLAALLASSTFGIVQHPTVHAATGPTIMDVTPSVASNTLYAAQPLSATITDPLPLTSIVFTLTDLTSHSSLALTAPTLLTGGVASTEPVAMTTGHIYSIAVTATDAAGNSTTYDQGPNASDGFLAVNASAPATRVSILPSQGVLSATLGGTLSTATFAHIKLAIDQLKVVLSGTQHAGFGYVELNVPFDSMTVCGTLNGSRVCESAGSNLTDASLSSRLVALQFATDATRSYGPIGLLAPDPGGIDLGPVAVGVPAAWQNVVLGSTDIEVTPAFPTCTVPGLNLSAPECSPDPLRFFLSDRAASMASGEQSRLIAKLRAKDPYAHNGHAWSGTAVAIAPRSPSTTAPCGSTSYTVEVASDHPVALSATGGPPGGSVTVTPSSLGGSGEAQLTQNVPCGTPDGTYPGGVVATPCGTTDCTTYASPYSVHVASQSQLIPFFGDVEAVAPYAEEGDTCSEITYTVAVAGDQTAELVAETTIPGGVATVNPSVINGSGTATVSVAIPCGTPAGTYNGWVNLFDNCGLSCDETEFGQGFTTAVVPALDTSSLIDWIWQCGAPPVERAPCVPAAVTPALPAGVSTAVSSGTVTYPKGYPGFVSSQYGVVCALGFCGASQVSSSISASCQYGTSNCSCPVSGQSRGCETFDAVTQIWSETIPEWSIGTGSPHVWFGTGGVNLACGVEGNPNSTKPDCDYIFQWGMPDDDGYEWLSRDGAALSWDGPWTVNYQSVQTDYYTHYGTCQMSGGWYSPSIGQGSWNYSPGGIISYQGNDGLAWQQVNQLQIPCSNPVNNGQNQVYDECLCGNGTAMGQLAGFGVGGDMLEANILYNYGYLKGQYVHSSAEDGGGFTVGAVWGWDHQCDGEGKCVFVASSTSGNVWDTQAAPVRYFY